MIASTYVYIVLFIFGLISVLCAKKIGNLLSLVDSPDGYLKKHLTQTPSTGGLGIFTTIAVGTAFIFRGNLTSQHIVVIVFLLGIFTLGILDDKLSLSVSIRLLTQVALVSMLLLFIDPFDLSGNIFLDFAVSAFFCLACINALNILDIMDGLAGGVAFFAILNCLLLFNSNVNFYTVISICTLISLLAFLVFNFNPATIFMGDAGSTFLGGLIATLILILFQQASTIQDKISYFLPIAVMFFELMFVIIVRINKGLNPMRGSPDHLPLRLIRLGFSVKETVFIVYLFAAVCCILSIMINVSLLSAFPLLSIFCIILLFVGHRMAKIVMEP